MRRLPLLVGAIVLVDQMFYAAITPLLPLYADRFALGKAGAGVLGGAYAAGVLLGALPGGWLVGRIGPRRTVVLGLVLLSLASIGFAAGGSVEALDAMRFLQGLGGACSWTGGLGWLLSETEADARGTTIGRALSAAVAGLLVGPALGALARAIGPGVPFGAVAALGVALAWAAWRTPVAPLGRGPAAGSAAARQPLRMALGSARVRTGVALVGMVALVFGAVEVLAPLQLDRLGASGVAIGAVFLVAAAIEVGLQVVTGRVADRRGRRLPLLVGLAGTAVFLALVPLPDRVLVLGVVVAVGCAVCGIVNTPAMALISDGTADVRVEQGFGFALSQLMWATGQVVGAVGGGALAARAGDALPYLLLAALAVVAFGWLARAGSRPREAAGTLRG